jgi:16S rRNA (adenine1518-N6/adenine1519-N6)-dimethyltransferase
MCKSSDMSRPRVVAKKSLGQHFLRSRVALESIVRAGSLMHGDTVLEIGPGEGALTERLLAEAGRVIAVETDERCLMLLQERFAEAIASQRLVLLAGDIRNDDTQRALFHETRLGDSPYKLVANIPYYITGMLFRLFLETLRQPSLIVFLIQKEVADEILAHDGKEGLLSLSIKAYGTPKYISKVKREAFAPPPKVDSAIIAITDISRERLGTLADADYFRVLKAGLSSRRKMLLGNLSHTLPISRDDLADIFSTLAIPHSARGEDLPADTWIALAHAITLATKNHS